MSILRSVEDSIKTEEEVFEEALTTVFKTESTFNLKAALEHVSANAPLVAKTATEESEQWPVEMCGRCYAEFQTVGNLRDSNCIEKPELLKGKPIGQYHCPDCGAMVMAGIPHPTVCERCATRTHPDYD